MIYRTVLLSTLLVSIVAAVHDHRKSSSTFTTAFVSPGAAPTVVRNVHAVASCYGVCSTAPPPPATTTTTTSTTALCSKKKKKSATAPGKGGKLQVQMLKAIEGTGRVGDVVMVAPAFFENKLRKTNSARLVTDEEVASQKKESSAKAAAKLTGAREVADKITDSIKTISFMKKAGPDGHLFGGIKTKDVLTELRLQFPTGTALDDKHVKVQRLRDAEGAAVDHDIIKYLGDFQATIALLDDVSADLTITVTSDKQ